MHHHSINSKHEHMNVLINHFFTNKMFFNESQSSHSIQGNLNLYLLYLFKKKEISRTNLSGENTTQVTITLNNNKNNFFTLKVKN